ncbi:copper homeostasis protein CutC [Bacillus sp. MRMR6]|uniref:copper homeostasis protein CutC n=1 Tax=Bacillus sp. MRMR6 TaxID=1928617 RepID=UPI0020CA04FE|nr:copper homeostasis protein CutC [Bacillus sp. MRMR6]
MMLIEYIATSVEDAIVIEKSGADRIELVASLEEGGLTPSYELIEKVAASVNIPVNVMVRPNSQSFVYTKSDLEMMKRDISIIGSIGVNGVVLGMLNEAGDVDFRQLDELLQETGNLKVSFHRAIDYSRDPVQTAKQLDTYKEINTILTSGGLGDWPNRMEMLLKMKLACKNTELLIGSGLSKENILEVHRLVFTGSYHFGTAVRINHSALQGVSLEKATEIVDMLK